MTKAYRIHPGIAAERFDEAIRDGGITCYADGRPLDVRAGFVVGGNTVPFHVRPSRFNAHAMRQAMEHVGEVSSYFGAWYDPDADEWVLEGVSIVDNRYIAELFAVFRGEKAIYDLATDSTIYV